MLTYIIIGLLSVLLIMAFISLEKEKRVKCDLILSLEEKKDLIVKITNEYNTKLTALNQRMQEITDKDNACANRLDDAYNERNHYKNKSDSLTKEVNSLKGKLSAQIKVAEKLFEGNGKAVLKIAQLEEQLLFANNAPATATQAFGPGTAESEQVPDPEAEQASQPTNVVRKPRRPRARTNKQAR